MAKKKKEKPKPKLHDVWEKNPVLHDVIDQKSFEFINMISNNTKNVLGKEWVSNLKENIANGLWNKHRGLMDDCYGLGKNKAVIGIGAGPSFNINKDVLKYYLNNDGIQDWDNRSFITIAANHQFKPLLEMGIIPDFILLVDSSDVVYDQLCVDIPSAGQNTILIAGLHCNPKVLKAWSDQKREIRFFVNTHAKVIEAFEKGARLKSKKYTGEMGGNVLNGAWSVSCQNLRSFVFLGVGNDLSFKIDDNLTKQREGYYADKDYSTNAWGTGTGRDEGKSLKRWGGFKITRSLLHFIGNPKGLERYNIELDVVGTSHTLWVYKSWLETTILRMSAIPDNHLHYFNCSEAGILGVMAKKDNDSSLKDKNNWYMLDEKCRCYHTAILKDAMEHFLKCKEIFECGSRLDVLRAVN